MKCYRCGKEVDRENSRATIWGILVEVKIELDPILPEDIEYYNKQLGKYSDGNGKCEVAICYECYIDGLFNIEGRLYMKGFGDFINEKS